MRWPWSPRHSSKDEQNGNQAALEKWLARARLDEQQRRWPEVRRALDGFTVAEEQALRRQQ